LGTEGSQQWSEPPAANGAEGKFGGEVLFAKTAGSSGFRRLPEASQVGIGNRPFAPVADQHRLAGFDLEHGDEEETEVVVHPLQACLVQAAARAASGRFVQDLDSGLNAANENEESFEHVGRFGIYVFSYLVKGLYGLRCYSVFVLEQVPIPNYDMDLNASQYAALSLTWNMNSSIRRPSLPGYFLCRNP
jgi:hypothetical protein